MCNACSIVSNRNTYDRPCKVHTINPHHTQHMAHATRHASHFTRHTPYAIRHTVTVFLLPRTEGTFDHVQFHCLGTSLVRVTRFRCGNLLFEIFHGLMGRREYTALVTYTRTCTCRMYTAHGTTIIHCIHNTVSGTSKTIQHFFFFSHLGDLDFRCRHRKLPQNDRFTAFNEP